MSITRRLEVAFLLLPLVGVAACAQILGGPFDVADDAGDLVDASTTDVGALNPSCAALLACCPKVPSELMPTCDSIVAGNNDGACARYLGNYQAAGDCTGIVDAHAPDVALVDDGVADSGAIDASCTGCMQDGACMAGDAISACGHGGELCQQCTGTCALPAMTSGPCPGAWTSNPPVCVDQACNTGPEICCAAVCSADFGC